MTICIVMNKVLQFAILLSIFYLSGAPEASAQRTYKKLSLGLEGGSTHHWSDMPVVDIRKHFGATADYFLTPYTLVGLEFQRGTLVGSEKQQPFRKFRNHYKSYSLTGKVHLGEFFSRNTTDYNPKREFMYNMLKGGYLGVGFGIMFDKQRYSIRNAKDESTYGFDKVTEFIFPLNIGWDTSAFEKRLIAGIKGQVNFVQGDNMDGYDQGDYNDVFGTVALTLKYRFGFEGRSRF